VSTVTALVAAAPPSWSQSRETVAIRGHQQSVYVYGNPQGDPVTWPTGLLMDLPSVQRRSSIVSHRCLSPRSTRHMTRSCLWPTSSGCWRRPMSPSGC